MSLEHKYCCRLMAHSKQLLSNPFYTLSAPPSIILPFRQQTRCCYYFGLTMSTSTHNTNAWPSDNLVQGGHHSCAAELDPDHSGPSKSTNSVLLGSPNDPVDKGGINEDSDNLGDDDDGELADGAQAPEQVRPWTFKQLLKRVKKAKGEASKSVVEFVQK